MMAEAWHRSSSRPLRSALVDYLVGAHAGRQTARQMDPEAAANCFLGPFVIYALSAKVFGRPTAATAQS